MDAIRYFFFLTFWVSAEPATDLTAFDELLERSNLDATEATFLLVVSFAFFAIDLPPSLSLPTTRATRRDINGPVSVPPIF